MKLQDLLVLLFLSGASLSDLAERRIRLWYALCFAAVGCIFVRPWGSEAVRAAGAFVPGLLLAAACALTKGQVGAGDAAALLTLGTLSGSGTVWGTLLAGILFSGGYAGVLLVRGKSRKARYPFIPFLLAGFAAALLTGAG